ncbi:MAG: cyclic nucleotide-binding domain-containing protein [Chloroflexi bacterium]|nr:cyclic nucleotide-binding domain-containing protein [Chloroflexota bacterium]
MLLTIEKVAILKSARIFSDTPDYILASVADIVEEIHVASGETFIHEGELGNAMHLVVMGEVQVHKGDARLAVFGPGSVVGELSVLSPAPRSASVTATEETRLFRIHKDAFDEVMADRPEIAQNVIRILVDRLRAANLRLEV